MNWISSLKEKSSKIAQLYKNELSDFVNNLSDDVKSLSKKDGEDPEPKKEEVAVELQNQAKSKEQEKRERYAILREVLEPFLHRKSIDIAELEQKVSLILTSPEKYLKRDPLNLVMMERKDFTNFLVFFNQHKSKEDIITKILSFEPTLPQILVTDEFKGNEKKDSVNRFVLRFVYSMIYLVETDVSAIQEQKKVQVQGDTEQKVQKTETEQKEKEEANKGANGPSEKQGQDQQESGQKEEEIYKI